MLPCLACPPPALPRNSLSVALNHAEDRVPGSIRGCATRSRASRRREEERGESGRGETAGRPLPHAGGQKEGFLPFALSKASERRSDRPPRLRGRTTK